MNKENERKWRWESAFYRIKRSLEYGAEHSGFGWKHRTAHLEFNLHPEDLQTLAPEQIYLPLPDYPSLFGILFQLTWNCGDHAFREGQNLEISIESRQEENTIFIEVCDNGPGIPHLENKKVGASTFTSDPNSSLGIALGCARVLGGDIFVENIINEGEIQGAKFTITLPIPKKA